MEWDSSMISRHHGFPRWNRLVLVLWTFAYLSTAIVVAIVLQGPPAERPSDSPATEFSSQRAFRHLQVIARKPRPRGSSENAEVRAHIERTIAALGIDHEEQKIREKTKDGEIFDIVNVVARIKGSGEPGLKAVLLMAHYDSVPQSPGASDDGLGTVTLLETLRALKAGPLPKRDIIALFTDGEEIGCVGSLIFVGQSRGGSGDGHRWMADVGMVFNFEGGGSHGPSYIDTLDQNGWLIREFAKADPVAVGTSLIKLLPQDGDLFTDLRSFRKAGVPGLDFMVFQGMLDRYHQPSDTPDTLDGRSLQHEGEHALSIARHFGNLDQDVQPAPNAVFFNPIGHWFVTYPGSWSQPLAVGALVCYAGALFLVWRSGQARVGGLVVGFVAFPIALVLGWVTVSGVIWLLLPVGLESDRLLLRGSTAGLALGVALVEFIAIYAFLAKRAGVCGLDFGALGWWTILTAVAAVRWPDGSYLPLWPLMFRLTMTTVLRLISWQPLAVLLMDLGTLPTITMFAALAYPLFTLGPWGIGMAGGIILFALGAMLPLITRQFVPSSESSDDHRTGHA
jgi:Peptidase family M28